MNIRTLIGRGLVLAGAVLHLSAFNSQAVIFTLQEQGGLTGLVNGGGGTVMISQIGVDHWNVTVLDAGIGNPTFPFFNLAFVEPETVAGMTAYNNVQVLSVAPGTATFDVLSDEFSPYSTIVPNGVSAPIQNTDVEMITLRFIDYADSIPEPGSASLFLGGAVLIWLKRAGRRKRGGQVGGPERGR